MHTLLADQQKNKTLVMNDPTWKSEIEHFNSLVTSKKFVSKESDKFLHILFEEFRKVIDEDR